MNVNSASAVFLAAFYGDKVKIRIVAPAEGGRANKEVTKLLEGLIGGEVSLVVCRTNSHRTSPAHDG